MSESLRNDGRIWVPKNPDETRSPDLVPEDEDEAEHPSVLRRFKRFTDDVEVLAQMRQHLGKHRDGDQDAGAAHGLAPGTVTTGSGAAVMPCLMG